MDKLKKKAPWVSTEADAFVDYPERRDPSLRKDEAVASPKSPKHSDKIRAVADSYASKKGVKLNHSAPITKVNSEHAGKIAQAYQGMSHDPNHPAVKSAYNALINETKDQYNHIMSQGGLKTTKIKAGQTSPYKSSKDLHDDLANNNHMSYFPTESAFGSGDQNSDHPMLQDTGHKDDEGKPLLANDMFRIVHDYFGHGKEGFGFGAAGEDNAYNHHKQMYSPEAQKALTTETRGQNSWVNFGPHGDHNRKNPSQTIYADQKAGLMPDWTMDSQPAGHKPAHKSEDLGKAEKNKLLGSDGSKDGITKGIKKFYYGTEVSLHDNGDGTHAVHNSKGKIDGVHVREHKGRWRFEHKPDVVKKSESIESSTETLFYICVDLDNAGRMMGQAVLSDDVEKLKASSIRIEGGMKLVNGWIESKGGEILETGGDESYASIPHAAIEDLEDLQEKFKKQTKLTLTAGVGTTISEAGKALMVGKFRGKDQVCFYDDSVESDLKESKNHLNDGTASEEEKKIGESYLNTKKEGNADMKKSEQDHKDCPYCKEMAENNMQDPDHCKYCHEMDKAKDDHSDCPYCAELDQDPADQEDSCPYCDEMGSDEDHSSHSSDLEPSSDTVPTYENPTTTDSEDYAGQDLTPPEIGKPPVHPGQLGTDPSNPQLVNEEKDADKGNIYNPDTTSADAMQTIAAAIDGPDEGSQDGSNGTANLDDAAMPIDGEMDDNTSRPDDYETDTRHDLGLAEDDQHPDDEPQLGQVLKDGLDSHADDIKKQRIVQMVGEALEGFKACKPILEKAKDQAPQLYSSSIAMLKAMIEMATMLGLSPDEDAAPEQSPDDEDASSAPAPAQTSKAPASEGAPQSPQR